MELIHTGLQVYNLFKIDIFVSVQLKHVVISPSWVVKIPFSNFNFSGLPSFKLMKSGPRFSTGVDKFKVSIDDIILMGCVVHLT